MNLIIVSGLSSDPPSEGLYFRFLTLMAKKELDFDVLLESEEEFIDIYYHFLKRKGWYDFIDAIVTPEEGEEGVRIDTELNYPKTIKVNYIRCENTPNVLGQLKVLREL
jgi:hypothetical protein